MDDKIFGVVSTISGLVIGWTLNEFSYLFRNIRENKKVLNQVLFIQLEIRDVLKKTDLNGIKKQLTHSLSKRFTNDGIDNITDVVGNLFYGFIQNELNIKFSKKIQELTLEYQSYLSTLSQIDPFITYSISNKDIILDYLGYIKNSLLEIEKYMNQQVLVDKVKESESKSNWTFQKHFDNIAKEITPFFRETAIETIESDIKTIAKKISIFKLIKTRRFLKRTHNTELDSMDVKKIESFLDNMIDE